MTAKTKFKLRGKSYQLSVAEVEQAAAQIEPKGVTKYSVNIGGIAYPPKQLLASALGIDVLEFTTVDASRVLHKLGFTVDEISAPARVLQSNGKVDVGELVVILSNLHSKGFVTGEQFLFLIGRIYGR